MRRCLRHLQERPGRYLDAELHEWALAHYVPAKTGTIPVNISPAYRTRQVRFMLDTDDPINIQYISGTTARLKVVTLCHHNVLRGRPAK